MILPCWLVSAVVLAPRAAQAINTIFFSPSDAGVTRSVPTWGVDTAWPNFDNVRQGFANIGVSNVGVVRVPVLLSQPLISTGGGNFDLSVGAKAALAPHLSLAAMAGPNIPLLLTPQGVDGGSIDPSYVSGAGLNVANYARAFKITQEYINSQTGFTGSSIYAIEPFNEPDFNFPNANPADLNSIFQQLKTYPVFQNTLMMGPSTLNSDLAQGWFNQTPQATAGSSHLLAGSLASWTDFIDQVNLSGKPFINPEIHSMGEMLAGAEHGMEMGMMWAEVLRGRGKLVQASDGKRLGYFEDLTRQAAAAVYRAPNGEIYAFAGGLERDYQGGPASFRFVSTDADVYFNGIPVREYVLHADHDTVVSSTDNDFANYGSWSHEGAYADVDVDDSGVPALDGYRWKIVNELTNQAMEVVNGSTAETAMIRSGRQTDALHQLWNIERTRNGYYHLYNANSGLTAEVANSSLQDGASVRQYGTADNWTQQWYIEETGDGSFYIRNANSHKYLTGNPNNFTQDNLTGSALQKWRFVSANPTAGPVAHYQFQGTVSDVAGSNDGAAFGNPGYAVGPHGMPDSALNLDGFDDYVQLPGSVAGSKDITVAAWVKWNGGDDWQRIFDFGNDTTSYMFLTPRSGDDSMVFAITEDSNGAEQRLATDPLPAGEWVHLAVTLGGNTGILYVDGVPRVAGQILLDPEDLAPANNYIGRSQWPDPTFDGMISDFRIYDYALDMSQVASLVSDGDADDDGDIDGADFLLIQRDNPAHIAAWQAQFGQSGNLAPISAPVPEPDAARTLAAMLIYGIAVQPLRRRRRQPAATANTGQCDALQ